MKSFVLLCALSSVILPFVAAERPSVCPFGYDEINRKCYKILDLSMTFFEAVTACDVIDGKLVEITSDSDQSDVTSYIQGHKSSYSALWMGATNLQGKWMFLSSKNSDVLDSWNSWVPGYPVPATHDDANNCASLTQNSGWKWENVPCSYHQGAMCYVQLSDDDWDHTLG